VVPVHSPAPSPGFPPEIVQRRDSSLPQARPGEQAGFDCCLVQPASVFGRGGDGEPAPQPASRLLAVPLHHRLAALPTQIIQDPMEGVGGRIMFCNFQPLIGTLGRGTVRSHAGIMPSRLRLHPAERIGRAPAFVLAVAPQSSSRMQGPRWAEIGVQDHRLFIDADHRFLLRERLLLHGQHVFHAGDGLLVQGGPAPHLFPATAPDHAPGAECGSSPGPPAAPTSASPLPGR